MQATRPFAPHPRATRTPRALAALGLLLPPLLGQAADMPGSGTLDSVIVTGTRSKDRTVLNSTAPIDVLSQDDLRRAAGPDGNLAAALQAMLPSFNFSHQSNSGGADHVRAAQLRGMSPDQVLVLVNGKRRHVTAIVNLESKLGKGTNPVDFNAIPINAVKRVEVLRDGAGAQYGSDAIAGVINVILDDAAEGGEIEAEAGAFHTRFVPTDQRITDGQRQELRAKYGLELGAAGALRFGAEFGHQNPTNRAGLDDVATQIDIGFVDDTPANRAANGRRNYRAGEPKDEQYSLWLNGHLDLSPDHTAYAFATHSHANSVGAAFYRYPDSSANITSVYRDGYRPETTGKNQDWSFVGGVKGGLGADWSYDTSLAYGRNHFDYGVRQSLNASLGPTSPTQFDLGSFDFEQLTLNADASRELAIGLAKPATLAVGAEVRQERFKTTAGDSASYAVGDFAGPGGAQAGPGLQDVDAVSLKRQVYGLYADLSADVTPQLFADAALRHDHYDDFGSATTGKLSARYALAPGLALRGAVSTNFRAPSLAQTGFSFTVTDRGGTEGGLTRVKLLPVGSALARSLGAQDLKAEKSRNISLGITAQPLPGIALSLDAYRIDVDDRITLSNRVTVPGTEDQANYFTNALDTRTRGVDFVAAWLEPLAGGDFKLTLAAGYNKTTIRGVHIPGQVGLEEINTLTDAAPHNRQILSAQWTNPSWNLLGRLTHHGSTTRVFDFGGGFVPRQTYAGVWQLDLEAELKILKNLSLALGGMNVTDRYPTQSISDISYFNNFPYDVISPIGFNGAYWYARLRATF